MNLRPDDSFDAQISRVLREEAANPAEFDEQFAPYLEVANELHRVLGREAPHLSMHAQVRHLDALRRHARSQPLVQASDRSFLPRNVFRWAAAAVLVILALVSLVRAGRILEELGTAASIPPPTPTEVAPPTATPKQLETAPAVLPTRRTTVTASPSVTPRATATKTPSATPRATSTVVPPTTLGILDPAPEEESEMPTSGGTEQLPSPAPEDPEQETSETKEKETPEPQDQETKEPHEEESPEPQDETAEPEDEEDAEDEDKGENDDSETPEAGEEDHLVE